MLKTIDKYVTLVHVVEKNTAESFSRILVQSTEKNGAHDGWRKRKKKENWFMLRQQGIQRKGQQTRFVDLISLLLG